MSSSRKRRRGEPPPYDTIAGWNELPSVTARRQRLREGTHIRPRRRAPAREPTDPDEPGDPRPSRRISRGRRILHLILAVFLVVVVMPVTLLTLAYWSAEIPDPDSVPTNQIATVYAADGTSVIAKIVPPQGNRIPVPLSDVPEPVRQAVLSAEDRDFYSNPGWSASAFLRAARDNLLGREDAGGGSTITQQYVKNAFLSSERTLNRKMRELVISAKMARQWSKDDILEAYLNTIYYGRGAYGIAAAAQAYFAKPVQQLTLAEGAVLAAVVRTPSALDPQTHLPQLTERWNYVLDGMVTMGVLNGNDRAATRFPDIVPATVGDGGTPTGPEGLIRTRVLDELRTAGITDREIDTGALRIVTTIDPRAQQAALDAVGNVLGNQPAELRTAVVSIDPRTGAVRGYYGGPDGLGFDFAQAPLQTGSAFKTFAVLAALQQGIPLTYLLDSAPLTVNGRPIQNVDGESCGTCPLSEAFKRSLNTSFYRLTETLIDGPRGIAKAAHQAGIPDRIPGVPGPALTDDGAPPQPSIVLGTYPVRAIDMASAYATLAASGTYHPPYFVQKVTTGDGRVLLDRGADPLPSEHRIQNTVADAVAQAMLPIAGYSNGHDLAGGRPSAAKTGTTQLGDTGQNKDAWMVGFTPSLSTAVWVGTGQPQPIRTARGAMIYGSGLPSDIWKQTMDGALSGTPVEQFPSSGPAPASGGNFDIFQPQATTPEPAPAAPPASTTPQPFIVIAPPATTPGAPRSTPSQVEIFPGLHLPAPG